MNGIWQDGKFVLASTLEDQLIEVLNALRELHDFATPYKCRQLRDKSQAAFKLAEEVLRKYEA